ncbi:MAG: hypothetical protein IKO74_04715 [Selenomonadaceae bacterium]|nr:hypothetical protein [Selenomonadaceae bacterium]
MTNEIKINNEEMLNMEELDAVAGGASVGSWFKAIGGTLLGVGAAVASITNPALIGVAVVSLAQGASGIIEVTKG